MAIRLWRIKAWVVKLEKKHNETKLSVLRNPSKKFTIFFARPNPFPFFRYRAVTGALFGEPVHDHFACLLDERFCLDVVARCWLGTVGREEVFAHLVYDD